MNILPSAVDIEKQVLGAMITEPLCIQNVKRILTADDFYFDYHAKIYVAILDLSEKGIGIDIITLANELLNKQQLEIIGGEMYLVEITVCVTSAAHHIYHARIIFEKSLQRQLITMMEDFLPRAYNPDDTFEMIDKVCDSVISLRSRISLLSETDVNDQLDSFIEYVEGIKSGKITRIPTHIKQVNALSKGGTKQGSYVFVGGEPGSGKTSWLLQMAIASARAGFKTEFIEGEMPSDELYERLLGIISKKDIDEAMKHNEIVTDFSNTIYNLPLKITTRIFPRNAKTLESSIMRAILRGAKLIILDYMQVFAEKGQSEFANIKAISEMLREKSLEYKISIVAASSLARGDDRKGMDRFYGGSQMMHDCSIAILLDGEQKDDEIQTGIRRVVLTIPKNRHGARTGKDGIALRYDLRSQSFSEYYEEGERWYQGEAF